MSYIPFLFPYSSIRCLPMDCVSREYLSKSLTAAPLPVSLSVRYSTVLILCFYVDVDESCPFCHGPNSKTAAIHKGIVILTPAHL